jgi:hypothetical protein
VQFGRFGIQLMLQLPERRCTIYLRSLVGRKGADEMAIDHSEREQTISCTTSATTSAPPCPVCGGVLVPMRDAWRCSRCYFSLCAGCEPVLTIGQAEE